MFCIAHTLGGSSDLSSRPATYRRHVHRLVCKEHDLARLLVLLGACRADSQSFFTF